MTFDFDVDDIARIFDEVKDSALHLPGSRAILDLGTNDVDMLGIGRAQLRDRPTSVPGSAVAIFAYHQGRVQRCDGWIVAALAVESGMGMVGVSA